MRDPQKIAEHLLSRTFSALVQLHLIQQLTSSERTQISRFSLVKAPPEAPSTVIVKQSARPYGFTFEGVMDGNIWQDWASLQFLTTIIPHVQLAPTSYGGDQMAGLFVLQDLGETQTLREVLLQADAEQARQGLVQFFTNLGKLHAQTRGHSASFLEIRRSLGVYDPEHEFYRGQLAQTLPRFQNMLAYLHIPASREAMDDLSTIIALLTDPGAFLTYIHGDPAPYNCLVVRGTSWLIDFEYGTYAHALLDGAQARMLFPACGFVNRFPAAILTEIETAYRHELMQGCPEASDETQFMQALTAACAYWAINFCVWRSFSQTMSEDCTWGISTVRQLYLLHAEIFAQTTKETGHFQALGAAFDEIAKRLRVLWPEATQNLPYYPAFRGEA